MEKEQNCAGEDGNEIIGFHVVPGKGQSNGFKNKSHTSDNSNGRNNKDYH